jgi:hypothetical protein
MVEGEVDQLRKAIEGLHRCSARLAQSVPVKEMNKGAPVWDGVVHIFDLEGHPKQPVSMHGPLRLRELLTSGSSSLCCITGWSGRQRMRCARPSRQNSGP